jgi:four helix bundle protein
MTNCEIRSYQDLKVWQEGMNLAEACYELTMVFPKEEIYGMTSQIRRASASIPANIAKGYGREYCTEYIHSLRTAQGSLKELETHILLSARAKVGLTNIQTVTPILKRCESVGKMLRALIRSLQNKERRE